MTTGTVLLRSSGLRVAFGSFTALNDVSADFVAGRKYACIGPNGAGKTTFLNALSGRQRPTAGSVHLDGVDITHLPAHRRLASGMGRSFQVVNIFAELSVRENLRLAVQATRFKGRQPIARFANRFPEIREGADRLIEEAGLTKFADVQASILSHGDQRALELALTLASNPRVLLLDEPLAGVGHSRIEQTMDLIRRAVEGRTVILVEHNMDAVMGFADEILVLYAGALLAAGTPAAIRANPEVRRAYLGE
jgi:branched-chain amino acid transport system ATP-binding protein